MDQTKGNLLIKEENVHFRLSRLFRSDCHEMQVKMRVSKCYLEVHALMIPVQNDVG